jgi:hypothetical protein
MSQIRHYIGTYASTQFEKPSKKRLKHIAKLLTVHPNSLMGPLATKPSTQRLRRKWTFDAINLGRVAGLLLGTVTKPNTLAYRKFCMSKFS